MNRSYLFVIASLTLICTAAAAAWWRQPADKKDLPDFVVSELRVQDFPARTYVFISQNTTIAQMGEVVPAAMEKLGEAIGQQSMSPIGPPIFTYKGATGEMDKPFDLEMGFPVAEGTKGPPDLQTRQLEKYHCATVLYSGGMKDIGQAYAKVFSELQQAGLTPTGDSREMHLYFESPDSPNNISLIMIGVK
jgi:effector-binding domain-containing protein